MVLYVFIFFFGGIASSQVPAHVPVYSTEQISAIGNSFSNFASTSGVFCPQAAGILQIQPLQICNQSVQIGNVNCLEFAQAQTASATGQLGQIGSTANGVGSKGIIDANTSSTAGNSVAQTSLAQIATACTTAQSQCQVACEQAAKQYEANIPKIQGLVCTSSYPPNDPRVIESQMRVKTALTQSNAKLITKSENLGKACVAGFGAAAANAGGGSSGLLGALGENAHLKAALLAGGAAAAIGGGAALLSGGKKTDTSSTSTASDNLSACQSVYIPDVQNPQGQLPALNGCQSSRAQTYCSIAKNKNCLSCKAIGGSSVTAQDALAAQSNCGDDPNFQTAQYGILVSRFPNAVSAATPTPQNKNSIIGSSP